MAPNKITCPRPRLMPRLRLKQLNRITAAMSREEEIDEEPTKPKFRSDYHEDLSAVFPNHSFTNHTGFELRHVVCDPVSAPTLDIVLATGVTTTPAENLCNSFARDFGYKYLDVPTYLRQLDARCSSADTEVSPLRELWLLHPITLKQWLAEGREVPFYFLWRILRMWIDDAVVEGSRKFLLSGLDRNVDDLLRFAEYIAEPTALISFQQAGEKIGSVRAAIEEKYTTRIVKAEYLGGEDGEMVYVRLLAALGVRAGLGEVVQAHGWMADACGEAEDGVRIG